MNGPEHTKRKYMKSIVLFGYARNTTKNHKQNMHVRENMENGVVKDAIQIRETKV